MRDLEPDRKRWLIEEPAFDEYARLVTEHLRNAVMPVGIWFDVTNRAKTVDSLIKKLIKKPKHTYDTLPDKAGVRIVVRYRSDLDLVIPLIEGAIQFKKIDKKSLGVAKVGYTSIHFDKVRLPKGHASYKRFPFSHFWVELQVRTLAQHLWSEMSHDSLYKNDETIQLLSVDVQRRVNLMAGQIEVADREFDKIGSETRAEDAAELLRLLESKYYQLTSRKPDIELSLLVLKIVLPLYDGKLYEAKSKLEKFFAKKKPSLVQIYDMAQAPDASAISPLLFQPEAIALFERLTVNKSGLRKAWSHSFPEAELEKVANNFGISFY